MFLKRGGAQYSESRAGVLTGEERGGPVTFWYRDTLGPLWAKEWKFVNHILFFFFNISAYFFFFKLWVYFIYLFIYLWLCWIFISVRGLSLVAASGGHSSSRCAGLSLSWPLFAEHRLQSRRLSNCGSRA